AANFDNDEARLIASHAADVVSFGIADPQARLGIVEGSIDERADGISALLIDRADADRVHGLQLKMPGRHNLSNALAAVAGAVAAGVPVHDACLALTTF